MDRVLTRKMRLRSGPGYSPISLERLEAGARRLIARNIGEDFTLSRVRWLTGGASKIQVAFDIEWNGPAGDRRQSTPMVLRMEPRSEERRVGKACVSTGRSRWSRYL